MPGINGKVPSPPSQILTVVLQNCEKSAVKNSIEKSVLLNFVNLPKVSCPKLSAETYFYL